MVITQLHMSTKLQFFFNFSEIMHPSLIDLCFCSVFRLVEPFRKLNNKMIISVLLLLLFIQVVLISATLPHEILEITSKFMSDPVRILVKRDELTLEVNNSWFFFLSIKVGNPLVSLKPKLNNSWLPLFFCYQVLQLWSYHFLIMNLGN
jgi:hypothetical protein